jgi:hypothetical protein
LNKDEYLVVSAERYTNTDSALPGEQTEIRFTLKHGDIKIVARCQSWDLKNNCGKLEVGHVYRFKRGDIATDLLSANDIHVVLSVEKESLEL